MNLFQYAEHIRSNGAAIEFLRQRGIMGALDYPPLCPECGHDIVVSPCYDVLSIICFIFFILVKVDIFMVKVGISWYRCLKSKKYVRFVFSVKK